MDKNIIKVNDEYELEYSFSDYDPSYEYFGRKFSVVLLEKIKDGERRHILHMDNAHKETPLWPPHVHKEDTKGRHYSIHIGPLPEPPWEDMKNNFLEYAIKTIDKKNKASLKTALDKLKFPK